MSLNKFIKSKSKEINSYSQDGFSCENYSIEPLISIDDYQNSVKKLDDKIIDRQIVIDAFKNHKYYDGFIYSFTVF